MARFEEKAAALIAEGEKKLQGGGFWDSIMGRGGNKHEEAAELFKSAANQYKIGKKHDEAGECFSRAAQQYATAGAQHEAASCNIDAAVSFLKTRKDECVRHYRLAIDYYASEGKFSMAAKHQKSIAEVLEEENDGEGAVEAYEQAADFFEGASATSSANKCWLKVAEYSALQQNYVRAIELFEKIAYSSLKNTLLKYGAKDQFLCAGLCRLCSGDLVSAKSALAEYKEKDMSFESQREAKLLENVIAAFEEGDLEGFTVTVYEHDRVKKLNHWSTTMLLRVKELIKEEDEGLT